MSVFKTLRDILAPRQNGEGTPQEKPKRAFDLSDSEVRQLQDLRNTDEWQTYLKCLDLQSTLYGEAMLQSASVERMWEMRGYVLGLRMSAFLVDEILQKEQESKTNDGRRRSRDIRLNDHRVTALVNTPSWGQH